MVPKAPASCPRVGKVWLGHMSGAGRKQLASATCSIPGGGQRDGHRTRQ